MYNYKVQIVTPNNIMLFITVQAHSMLEAREIGSAYGRVLAVTPIPSNRG